MKRRRGGGGVEGSEQPYEALGGQESEPEVAEQAGIVEEVERAAELAAEEECLREHVDVARVARGRGHLVGEEDGRLVEVLPSAVPHHPAQPLQRLLPHLRRRIGGLSYSPPLGARLGGCFGGCGGCGRDARETEI